MRKKYGICPRCHRKISWIEKHRRGDRTYIIAVHYLGSYVKNGKRIKKIEKCYLGPEDQYEYVSHMHAREGLMLRGIWDRERAIEYMEILAEYIGKNGKEFDENDKERIRNIIEKLRKIIL